MFELTTLTEWPASCSGWGYAVGAAAARIPPKQMPSNPWPAAIMANAAPDVRQQVAALVTDDVLIELAYFAETGDAGHIARARRIVDIFGDKPPPVLARLIEPYQKVYVRADKGEARASDRVRRELLVGAVDHELDRKRRGCPGAVSSAKAAYERVGATWGLGAGSVKQAVEGRNRTLARAGRGPACCPIPAARHG